MDKVSFNNFFERGQIADTGSKIICWFSGGVTSAVACKLAIGLFGKDNCRSIFMDTGNEDYDTYRFKNDCEKWFGIPIETITGLSDDKFPTIQSVWRHYKSLNVANGAICSSTLKRDVRLKWQKENDYSYQVFGFDIDEWSQVNANENATLNKVEDAFTVAEGSFETVEENKKFDLLLANVNRGAIWEMKNQIVDHVKEGGDIILSGILAKEQDMVKSAEPFVSPTHVKTTSEEEWVAIHYKK